MSAAQRKRARDLANSCPKYDNNKQNRIRQDNSSDGDVETTNQISNIEAHDPLPIITIPVITDEELNVVIQSIANSNNLEVPDTLVADCTINGEEEQVIYCDEPVNCFNEIDIEQIEMDAIENTDKSSNEESSVQIEVVTATVHNYYSPKKLPVESLTDHNIVLHSNKISDVMSVDKENVPPTIFLPTTCEESILDTAENNITEEKENATGEDESEKITVSTGKDLGNIDLISKEIEERSPRIEENNINIDTDNIMPLEEEKTNEDDNLFEYAEGSIVNTESTSKNFEDVDSIPIEDDVQTLTDEASDNIGARPKRGRKRRNADQNRAIREKKAKTNEGYISAKGKKVEPKIFSGNEFQCNCTKNCTEKLSTDVRKAEFEKFWKSGSYEARCALLQGYVKEFNKKRSYSVNSKRTFTRKYYIQNIEICKTTFLKTFGISQARIDSALKKNRNNESIYDKRGVNCGGKNSITSCQLQEMQNFIAKLPRYMSHYCRNSRSSNYLAPNLNLPTLYNTYKENSDNAVSFSRFRQCFMNDFNLKFKKPQKDTCLGCDTYKANIAGASGEQ